MFDRAFWKICTENEEAENKIMNGLKVSRLCAGLLVNRGYDTVEKATDFLYQPEERLCDPYLLDDIKKAAERIVEAVSNGEKIYIYGDYDVDGVTSVTLLYLYLKEKKADVSYYIPSRDGEGYGISPAGIEYIKSKNCSLIITVDTGITAGDEIEKAKALGMDIIITDHHSCRETLPDAYAVINPKRLGSKYPFDMLCGVAVVFKLVCAVEFELINGGEYNQHTLDEVTDRYLDLVAIGTVADVMPLVGENRTIVSKGLALLKKNCRIGIKSLIRACSGGVYAPERINSSYIGFTLAPKINAVGRISDANYAVELFLSDSPSDADIKAARLCEINKERQAIENEIYKEAISKIQKPGFKDGKSVYVLYDEKWHPGVIGIVASRITERYGVPCVMISFTEADGSGKGSARSVEGIDITDAFSHCRDYLVKYGGHSLAAGLTVTKDKLDDFITALNSYIKGVKSSSAPGHFLYVDAYARAEDMTLKTAAQINMLEPFGASNPQPSLILRAARIIGMTELSMGKHTRLRLESPEGTYDAVFFGINLIKNGFFMFDDVDVVFNLSVNEYRNVKSIQLIVRDIALTEMYEKSLDGYFTAEKAYKALAGGDTSFGEIAIPDNDTMADIFRAMRKSASVRSGEISVEDIRYDTGVSYLSARIALDAFEQTE